MKQIMTRMANALKWPVSILGVASLILFFCDSEAKAFPELSRHGYFQCSSCHYSPSGGGVLTDYGRALSKEILSHGSWFFEAKSEEPKADGGTDSGVDPEARFLHGHAPEVDWLKWGGDIRALQAYRDNAREISGRFLLMQADLEVLVQPHPRFRFAGAFGRDEPRVLKPKFADYLISRRHWVAGLLGPEEEWERYQIRIGRFFPAFGLQVPEHAWVTRRKLGFDQSQETYNIEGSWQGESASLFLTGIGGRPDSSLNGGSGLALSGAWAPSKDSRIGASGWWTKDSQLNQTRRMIGFWGSSALIWNTYFLVEWDWVSKTFGVAKATDVGWTNLAKLGWEATQGFHFFVTQEYDSPSSFVQSPSGALVGKTEAYGLGIQYFPRPHWDLSVHVRRERSTALFPGFDSVLWLNAHYYL